ncbi:Polysaccharide deacetylase protein [Pseudomonas amygdali pv. sesami]|nr:Polysaccharide deacetylase protein [Pseudomonas amygdali pv. sesami]
MRIVLAVCAGLFWLQAQAAVPVTATIDRSVWPERLETPGLFDVASRAEILAFAHELYLSEKLDEEGLKQRLGLRFVNVPSLNVVRHRLWLRLLENYQNAQKSCEQDANFCVLVEDMDQLRQRAEEFQVSNDSFYANWARPGAVFHQRYLNELLFMAALFPQTSSEIERYNSDEMSGDEMPDRTFMLNFESGPSPVDGGTDWLADFMRQQKMTATFFVLGKSLQERLDSTSTTSLQALYRQQCVGIQGWEYRSHSQWLDWQDSVQRSAALVQRVLPDNFVPLFRPPYGHRRRQRRLLPRRAFTRVIVEHRCRGQYRAAFGRAGWRPRTNPHAALAQGHGGLPRRGQQGAVCTAIAAGQYRAKRVDLGRLPEYL